MGFHEKTHAYLAAKYYQHLTQTFGERGKEAFVHATRYYAMQRGRRMAQRAIRDGKPLTQASYNYYGEWVPSEEMKAMDAHNQSAVQPDGALKITRCPWHAQFVEMGMEEAGREYCKVLDSAISLGFNPELGYTVEQTLHTHDCCIHRLRASSMGEGAELGKCPSGLRDFSYHCAHLYWSFQEVCTAIFAEEGQAVSQAVLADFQKDYGAAMCQTLLSFEHTNFQIC